MVNRNFGKDAALVNDLYNDIQAARPKILALIGETWSGSNLARYPNSTAAREAGIEAADRLVDVLLATTMRATPLSGVRQRSVLDFALRMLAVAKADRAAAILLWDARNHPLAVSHVIQSCEKASKSVVIAMKATDVRSANKYGHQAVKNILSMVKTQLGQSMLDVQSALEMRDRRQLFEDVFEKVDSGTWDVEVRNMRRGAVGRYFRVLRQMPATFSVLPEAEQEVKTAISKMLPRWRKQVMSADLWTNSLLSEILVKLYLLTAFMNPHRNTTRYPDIGYGPEDYDRLAPIIEIVRYEVLMPLSDVLRQTEELLIALRRGQRMPLSD